MLKNIKSSYFIKILFSFVNEKPKLKSIKYNKNLQNNLNININNYIHFSRKYIIYETNRKGKEYAEYGGKCVELEYEGEYLNGERNGKRKEFDFDGKIHFEGEYLHGKRMEKEKNMILMVN